MTAFRVTERSIATNVLVGLQGNLDRLGNLQQQLSSGKQFTKPSDSPAGATAAMQYRGDLSKVQQYGRNASKRSQSSGLNKNQSSETSWRFAASRSRLKSRMTAPSVSGHHTMLANAARKSVLASCAGPGAERSSVTSFGPPDVAKVATAIAP